MVKKRHLRSFKIITLMVMFSLIAPFGVQASNSLYQDVCEVLINNYGGDRVEAGGFAIAPTTNDPTASFEARMDKDDKLVELYADTESTYAPPTSTKSYRTIAYQYFVTPSQETLNSVITKTRPLPYIELQKKWVELVRSTNAYKNGQYKLKVSVKNFTPTT